MRTQKVFLLDIFNNSNCRNEISKNILNFLQKIDSLFVLNSIQMFDMYKIY